MPPKQRISKEQIVEAALSLVREGGIDAVNARSLSKRIGCSTQPIFSQYASMDALKETVRRQAEDMYNTTMMDGLQNSGDGFLGMGLAYIRFARTEPSLFRLLFMSDTLGQGSVTQLAGSTEGDPQIIGLIASMTGLAEKHARQLYSCIWFTTHGIASLVATNSCEMEEQEIRGALEHVFKGLMHALRQEQENEDQ